MPDASPPRSRLAELRYFAREVRRRPWRFLLRRGAGAVRARARTACQILGLRPYTPGWRRRRTGHSCLLDLAAVDRAISIVVEHHPEEFEAALARAERLVAGEITVLSHTLALEPGELPDWHRDFVSGHRWPVRFHTRYAYRDLLDLGRPSDVKVPWELSRLQSLPALALAYRLGGDVRHLERLVAFVSSWRDANPAGHGVNWAVGMEVALRAFNLVTARDLLEGVEAAGERLASLALDDLLARHGRFLERNLEYSDVNGNHYTACLLGLLVIGLHLPDERHADQWVRTARRGLREEMPLQTYPDGVCHEGSIPYHRLVLELFLHAELAARRRGVDLGDAYRDRLLAMMEFTAAYTKPNGRAPAWGDDDSGRVTEIGHRPLSDHRSLLAAGAALSGREDLWQASGPLSLDVLAFLEVRHLERIEGWVARRERPAGPPSASRAFAESGFWILRRSDDYCLIDCGDVGLRGRGGHGHNDALSVEVALGGLDVLTDSGCASYTRSLAARATSIGARAHNVATIDGAEPAPLASVRFPHATATPVEPVRFVPREPSFTGRHTGYRDRGIAGAYQRTVRLAAGALVIEDTIEAPDGGGADEREVTWRFQLAERWQPVEPSNDRDSAASRGKALLFEDGEGARLILGWDCEDAEAALERVTYHPDYDRPAERWRATVTARARLPVGCAFRLEVRSSRRSPG